MSFTRRSSFLFISLACSILVLSTILHLAIGGTAIERPVLEVNTDFSTAYGGSLPETIETDWDSARDTMKRVQGLALPVSTISPLATDVNRVNAEEVFRSFMVQNEPILSIDTDDMSLRKVWDNASSESAGNTLIVHFQQRYNGLRVVGSRVTGIFRNQLLSSYRSSYVSDIQIDPVPNLNAIQAFSVAKTVELNQGYVLKELEQREESVPGLDPLPNESDLQFKASELVVFPIKSAFEDEIIPRLAWVIDFEGISSPPMLLRYYIDAHSGFFLARRNLVSHGTSGPTIGPDLEDPVDGDESTTSDDSVHGNVTGQVFPEHSLDTPITGQVMEGISITVDDATRDFVPLDETDAFGNFSINGLDCTSICTLRAEFADFYDAPFHIVDFQKMAGSFPPFYMPSPAIEPAWSIDYGFTTGSQTVNVDLGSEYESDVVKQATQLWHHLHKARDFFSGGGGNSFNLFQWPDEHRILAFIDRPPFEATNESNFKDCQNYITHGDSLNVVTDEIENEFDHFISFNNEGTTGTYPCKAGAYSADVIYHEFGHIISSIAYEGNGFISESDIGKAIREGVSDYWAATLTDDPVIGDGFLITGDGSGLRTVNNTRNNSGDYSDFNSEHENGLILGGALWDLRLKFMARFGPDEGKQKANELIFEALMSEPEEFYAFGAAVEEMDDDDGDIYNGSPNLDIICEAFYDNHGIAMVHCQYPPDDDPTPTPTPTPTVNPGVNKVSVPIDSTSIDLDFSNVLGSVTSEDLASFSVGIKPYGASTTVSNATVSLGGGGGSDNVYEDLLATLDTTVMKNGCYYNVELKAYMTDGTGPFTDDVVVKHTGGHHDPMPRMVCVYRTAHHGGENDACQMIALVSDPKPAYYNMGENDWRRGRSHLIAPRPSTQFNATPSGYTYYGGALCDPDGHSDCLRDCWNITGTSGNQSGGNDGLDNIFCLAGHGCSPPSFSGCESSNDACKNQAFADLEAVYHKVLYLHYANWEFPTIPWMSRRVRTFKSCEDDGGDQFYSVWAEHIEGDTGWPVISRRARAASDRSGGGIEGDIFDRFDQLYSSSSGPAVFSVSSSSPIFINREGINPETNCQQCGCADTSAPYCNSGSGECESKCYDGTPFGQCSKSGISIQYCDGGTLVNGCQRPECAALQCDEGYQCNESNGRCVQCLSDLDCNDGTSCTTDSCLNGFCRNDMIPNDCSLSTAPCGPSPSGCYTCGCPTCGQVCRLVGEKPDYHFSCVARDPCDPQKCEFCPGTNDEVFE